MRIVLTGGAGFIGSTIADAYVALGHDLLVIDDLSTGRARQVPSHAELVKADIRSVEAAAAIHRFRPDLLNHHAAQMDVRRSVSDPVFDAQVNILGLLNLLEAARTAGCQRIVFASSGGAGYGEQDRFPADESHPTRPASPYGVSKRASELYLQCYAQMYGLHCLALRYANVYGPRQNAHGEAGVVAIFCQRLLAQQPCTIFGDGEQTRDFVYVDDVVRANVAALTASATGEINIGTGVESSVNQVYAELQKTLAVDHAAIYAAGKIGEQRRSAISSARAEQQLRWRPQVALRQGLGLTVAYFRQDFHQEMTRG